MLILNTVAYKKNVSYLIELKKKIAKSKVIINNLYDNINVSDWYIENWKFICISEMDFWTSAITGAEVPRAHSAAISLDII